jgi:hypothetical protein
MTSIEGDRSALDRCNFNKPYGAINVVASMSSSYLPSLKRIQKYLVWLDYDFGLTRIVIDDISTCFARLCPGSVFFLTIDMELPDEIAHASRKQVFEHYREELSGEAFQGFIEPDFAASKFDETVRRILSRAVRIGLRGRPDVSYLNLISLYYKDTHRMYSMGGVFGTDDQLERLRKSPLMEHQFVREDFITNAVEIPRIVLTRKERLFLERFCLGTETYDGSIGVSEKLASDYKTYYRYLPSFAEIL